jgi:hypothetical protein
MFVFVRIKMVNPLMSSKQEPFSGISDVLGAHSSSFVKLELDHDNGDDDDKIEVKMEVLEEFFGLGFGVNNMLIDTCDSKESLIGGESLLAPLGPPPSYPGTDLPGAPMVRTVKVPLSSEVNEGQFPPVLSIPGSFSLTSPTGGLHISISPHSQGPDTTTLTSPPPSLSSSSSSICSSNKKPIFTAKGLELN